MGAFQLAMQLLPVAEEAIQIICKANGVTVEEAFNILIAHLTPGQPAAAALAPNSVATTK